jgi:hypothetical protein
MRTLGTCACALWGRAPSERPRHRCKSPIRDSLSFPPFIPCSALPNPGGVVVLGKHSPCASFEIRLSDHQNTLGWGKDQSNEGHPDKRAAEGPQPVRSCCLLVVAITGLIQIQTCTSAPEGLP